MGLFQGHKSENFMWRFIGERWIRAAIGHLISFDDRDIQGDWCGAMSRPSQQQLGFLYSWPTTCGFITDPDMQRKIILFLTVADQNFFCSSSSSSSYFISLVQHKHHFAEDTSTINRQCQYQGGCQKSRSSSVLAALSGRPFQVFPENVRKSNEYILYPITYESIVHELWPMTYSKRPWMLCSLQLVK